MKLISIRKMKKRINVPANVKMGRICAIWLFCIALQAISIPILAQSAKITLRLKNVTVEEVLTSIENQTEYRFLYNKDIVDVSRIVSISVKNELMTLVLDRLFKGEGVSYTIEKRQIVLNKVSSRAQDNKQPVKVTGKVVDESGEALPGVTVMIEGATQGTITGIDGNYQLQVPEGSTLKFTSIGYTTYTQKITRPMTLNVTMKEDSKQLDEVVVVGYGTTTRKNLTTSIATVKTEKISRAATSNMSQMLLGRAAGLEATLTSPQPGGAVDLSIRGAGRPNINGELKKHWVYLTKSNELLNQQVRNEKKTQENMEISKAEIKEAAESVTGSGVRYKLKAFETRLRKNRYGKDTKRAGRRA